MLAKLLFMVITALPGQTAQAAGEISNTVGPVTIVRGGQTLDATPGMPVQSGDLLKTGPGGRAGILLEEGHLLTLGAGTSASLRGPAAGRVLSLDRGEARITAGGDHPFAVTLGQARAQVSHGILRATTETPRFAVERGTAEFTSPGRAPVRLDQGEELSLSPNAVPTPVGNRGWTIRPEDLQLSARPEVPETEEELLRRRRLDATIPPAPDEGDTTRSTTQPTDESDATTRPYQPIAVSQPTSVSGISLALGGISASSSAATSGAAPGDAQQDSRNLLFPGNIHLVTAESRYQLNNVRLTNRDHFPTMKQFWAIGVGPTPTGQVSTDFRTATNPIPTTIRIPRTDAYLVRFDQVGLPDLANLTTTPSLDQTTVGIFGLLGANPIAPQVVNARPLLDNHAQFNNRATFALGELAVERQGNRPVLDIRRSDQDRQIIKSPQGDDFDTVTPNKDVRFMQVTDAKFFPDVPKVFVPASNQPGLPTVSRPPTFGNLDLLRKAAATTLLADSLHDYSRRTGQTRFVVDNRIIDITGYTRARANSVNQIAMQNALLRTGHAAPGMSGGPVSARHGTRALAAKKR